MSNHSSFNERCYQLLKLVPEGRVTTYREIARALKSNAWRAVGSAMAKNRQLIVIPCHRVVRSYGSIGQYASGVDAKANLLIGEGVDIVDNKVKDLKKHLFQFGH